MYQVHVTREGDQWLADVPELEGTQTYAPNLTALDRYVREAIVLGADLPDEAMTRLELTYSVVRPPNHHVAGWLTTINRIWRGSRPRATWRTATQALLLGLALLAFEIAGCACMAVRPVLLGWSGAPEGAAGPGGEAA